MGAVRVIDCESRIAFEGGWVRCLEPGDVHDGYVSGLNDPEVNRYLVGVRLATQTVAGVDAFVRQNREAPGALLLGIWLDGSSRHSGTIRLHGIEHQNHTAHIGICLFDKAAWGKGIATRSIRAATSWALAALGLRWIEAGVYEGNVASAKAFMSAGYAHVYDIPDKYLYDGRPIRVSVLAARSHDFPSTART